MVSDRLARALQSYKERQVLRMSNPPLLAGLSTAAVFVVIGSMLVLFYRSSARAMSGTADVVMKQKDKAYTITKFYKKHVYEYCNSTRSVSFPFGVIPTSTP